MISFKPLQLEDVQTIKPFFERAGSYACDCTIGGTFIWRDFFGTHYAIIGETLFFRVRYLGGVTAYTIPQGGDLEESLCRLRRHCRDIGEQLIFCTVSEKDLLFLKSRLDCCACAERDWFDYLYNAEDLSTFVGKRYNGQRNHINFFKKSYTDYSFEVITAENLPDVFDFYDRYTQITHKDSKIFLEDQRKVYEVLANFEAYGMLGGAIRVDGDIIAFALGEIFGDTLFVHIEKADICFRGAYQMIVREFSSHFCTEGINFINREDDAGDEGLRKSKLSYHPCRLIEKYTVLVQE